jgi:BirA family biotin operon repressor/biotin-[acetyl-CoA-carboxylase] ligase
MEKDFLVKIIYLDTIDSTQTYLKNLLKNKQVISPCAVVSNTQTDGLGSRGNSWDSSNGNLFLSFSISLKDLPFDLKLESASIYFAYILKDVLSGFNSSVWLKWPNDFYLDKLKVGGMITNLLNDNIICGVGLNLVNSPKEFATLDISISREKLLDKYFANIEKNISWKQVFSKYKLEFYRNKKFSMHKDGLKVSLAKAKLQSDGSVVINGERIYSLR